MKKLVTGLAATLVAGMVVGAPVYTVTLPPGVTNTLTEAFANAYVTSEPTEDVSYEGLCAAADLRIAGAGRLEINQDLKSAGYTGEVHVARGAILRITANGALGDIDHGTFVADGATLENECLDTSDNSKLDFAKEHLTFAGTGVDDIRRSRRLRAARRSGRRVGAALCAGEYDPLDRTWRSLEQ